MQSTKIYSSPIIIVFAIVTMWSAMQWTAWRLRYQPQLGRPWFELARGVPVYVPPACLWWWVSFDAYAPDVFFEGALIASSEGPATEVSSSSI